MTGHFILQSSPHVRSRESSATVMGDMMIALLPLYLMAFYYYGWRTLLMGLVGIFTAQALDLLTTVMSGRKPNWRDFSAAVTGMILPLLLPASAPYYVVATGVAVAILAVKFPFGGTGNNLFNPAAVGFAFVAFCWPGSVFSFPVPLERLALTSTTAFTAGVSPAYSLAIGAIPEYDALDMLLGAVPGPMGATNILVILACALFLIVRGTINWRLPLSFIITAAVMSALFPRVPTSAAVSVEYELFSGCLMFGAVFVLTEPVTTPKRDTSKVLYGICSAVAVMLFRYFGGFEEAMMFAMVIMNVLSPAFDYATEKLLHKLRTGGEIGAGAPAKEEQKQSRHSRVRRAG